MAVNKTMRTLRISNLPTKTFEDDIWELFQPSEKVLGVRLVKTDGDLCAGYGFLDFSTALDARRALENHSGLRLAKSGVSLDLSWATTSTAAHIDSYQMYVGNLPSSVTDGELFSFCKNYNDEVSNAKVIIDQQTGLHRGYGFVRFATIDAAFQTVEEMQKEELDLHGSRILIRETHKTTAREREHQMDFPSNTTMFIGQLHMAASEDELRNELIMFGPIESVRMLPHRGLAFVSFTEHVSCLAALSHMQGRPIRRQNIYVAWGRMRPLGTDPSTDDEYRTSGEAYNFEWHAAMMFNHIPPPPSSKNEYQPQVQSAAQAAYWLSFYVNQENDFSKPALDLSIKPENKDILKETLGKDKNIETPGVISDKSNEKTNDSETPGVISDKSNEKTKDSETPGVISDKSNKKTNDSETPGITSDKSNEKTNNSETPGVISDKSNEKTNDSETPGITSDLTIDLTEEGSVKDNETVENVSIQKMGKEDCETPGEMDCETPGGVNKNEKNNKTIDLTSDGYTQDETVNSINNSKTPGVISDENHPSGGGVNINKKREILEMVMNLNTKCDVSLNEWQKRRTHPSWYGIPPPDVTVEKKKKKRMIYMEDIYINCKIDWRHI
eukprot:GHVL01017740.1.p1 GENE.GHVL01017740.1~~GHVL01017740.1.p1  ORF type:complete len:613 (-),score=199.20 GHVL01017740.1:14-1852(-)